jgi:hypothetical protein
MYSLDVVNKQIHVFSGITHSNITFTSAICESRDTRDWAVTRRDSGFAG